MQQPAKILDVPMQVARDQNFVPGGYVHDVAYASRRSAKSLGRPGQRGQKSVRIEHELILEKVR